MKTLLFAVFDSKAACYGTPFFSPKEATAMRSFAQAANDPNTMVFNHPEDFSLFHLGEFDDVTGELFPSNPRNLGNAAGLKRPSFPAAPATPLLRRETPANGVQVK